MSDPFVGVLVTRKRKHLLVDDKTRRTACGKVMKAGAVYDGLARWDDEAPLQCPKCAKAWKDYWG